MAKIFSLSLFTRLYLTIAAAVIVSGTLTFFAIDRLDQQSEVDDFVFFADYVYTNLVKKNKIEPDKKQQNLTQAKQFIDEFSMNWQILPENTAPCADCELIGRSGNVEVYSNSYDQLLAVYPLAESKAWLIISEEDVTIFDEPEITGLSDLSDYQEQIEEETMNDSLFDDIAPIALLLIVLITIATAIYWPIRALQSQIERLIETQHQFGMGDMDVKADEKLSKPLNELATSFNTMASSIKETVNENQIFAQAVPHEVRTPLSRIQLATGLLRKNNKSLQEIELLENIDTYIGDINELISQVVAFSKLNTTSDECEFDFYQSIELIPFIESRIKATKCEEKLNVIWQNNGTLEITTNPVYLRLLVDNLLKNASIYGKTRMTISLQALSDHIELVVEDDGDGIPSESFETIFIPFSRLDVSRSRKTGGLGLGLAISKAACKRMNCELTVENSSNAGAKFICRFFKY